jgi:hypothetical protein
MLTDPDEGGQKTTTAGGRGRKTMNTMCWRSLPGSREGIPGRVYGSGMLLLLALTPAVQAANMTVTQTLTAGTCTLDSTASQGLTLNAVSQDVFKTSVKDTTSGATFAVKATCDGAPNPNQTNIIRVSGIPDTGDTTKTLFKNTAASGAAKGLGFVLTNDTDGSGTPLPSDGTGSVSLGLKGGNANGQHANFYVMPSRGSYTYANVTAGALSSTLTFTWDLK